MNSVAEKFASWRRVGEKKASKTRKEEGEGKDEEYI